MAGLTEAAAALAAAGWSVFPVDRVQKRPLTEHGHLDATRDLRQIEAWAPRFERGAIATPTGNGLLIIDVDPRNGGRVPSWAPETLTVKTQSGGLHLYYKVDEDIKSRASLFAPGVDSKSRGGYVLLPPSPGYEWVNVRPRASLTRAFLEAHFAPDSISSTGGTQRLAPERWERGIIHDQVVAWAAYFAGELDDDAEVEAAVWSQVQRARDAGLRIDNARDHIGSAIRWVLQRESRAADTPLLD